MLAMCRSCARCRGMQALGDTTTRERGSSGRLSARHAFDLEATRAQQLGDARRLIALDHELDLARLLFERASAAELVLETLRELGDRARVEIRTTRETGDHDDGLSAAVFLLATQQ